MKPFSRTLLALAAVFGLALASTAQAALIDVASIEFFTSNAKTSGKLKISEVVLTEVGTGNDLALASAGAVATGYGKKVGKKNRPAFVIDGKKSKKKAFRFRGKKGFPARLRIDLAKPANIESLNVFGKLKKGKKDFLGMNFLDSNGQLIYRIGNLKKALGKNKKAPLVLPNIATGGYNGGTGGVSAVPVPASIWLFASGLMGVVGLSRRRGLNAGA